MRIAPWRIELPERQCGGPRGGGLLGPHDADGSPLVKRKWSSDIVSERGLPTRQKWRAGKRNGEHWGRVGRQGSLAPCCAFPSSHLITTRLCCSAWRGREGEAGALGPFHPGGLAAKCGGTVPPWSPIRIAFCQPKLIFPVLQQQPAWSARRSSICPGPCLGAAQPWRPCRRGACRWVRCWRRTA